VERIYMLTDYKGFFGSKHNAIPYRSGMDKELLKKYLNGKGYDVQYLPFSDVDFRNMNFKNQFVLYTSSEDKGFYYKDYIEDIILGLSLQNAILIPEYKFLRANNNKVFMEILRDQININSIKNIKSHHFGTIEELKQKLGELNPQSVIKPASGAMSTNVNLSKNRKDVIKFGKKISRTKDLLYELLDFGRSIKHKQYIRESRHRKKFIIQNFIKGLRNDWKIVIYGKKYYILYRGVRDNDFRASGSGKFEFKEEIPHGILDFAEKIFNYFNVPNLSIDVAFNGKEFYLIEFQAIYFGTTTIDKSPFYFTKENSKWVIHKEKSFLEKEYVESVIDYISKNFGKDGI